MNRTLSAVLLIVAVASPAALAQDGPLSRAGRALDQTGKNMRSTVETGIARGQISAHEKELLNRVTYRLSWDKHLASSTIQVVVEADGTVNLKGSVRNAGSKKWAVALAENTVGVTRVVDELAVVQEVKVIEAAPRVIETRTVDPERPVLVVPPQSRVIVKP